MKHCDFGMFWSLILANLCLGFSWCLGLNPLTRKFSKRQLHFCTLKMLPISIFVYTPVIKTVHSWTLKCLMMFSVWKPKKFGSISSLGIFQWWQSCFDAFCIFSDQIQNAFYQTLEDALLNNVFWKFSGYTYPCFWW